MNNELIKKTKINVKCQIYLKLWNNNWEGGRSLAYNKTAPTKPTKAPRPTLAAEPSDWVKTPVAVVDSEDEAAAVVEVLDSFKVDEVELAASEEDSLVAEAEAEAEAAAEDDSSVEAVSVTEETASDEPAAEEEALAELDSLVVEASTFEDLPADEEAEAEAEAEDPSLEADSDSDSDDEDWEL